MKFKLVLLTAIVIVSIFLFLRIIPKKIFSNEQAYILENNLNGDYDFNKTTAYFHGSTVKVPSFENTNQIADVLGTKSKSAEKQIRIDLSAQKLYAYEGNKKVMSFSISSGKWFPTPTGEFRVWVKLNYVLMTGGSSALGTYYYLPNVPYTMFFYNDSVPKYKGFSVHGTYWHHNFGHPMSHGCVNMRTEDAKALYDWASVNIKVIIYGVTPKS